ncbi:MAG: exopolysaccharide Pel transporter PelG [Thiobacillus sp.]
MAGIGFELRKILRRDNYLSLFQAYTYAGLISSGPWILSILGVLFIGLLSFGTVSPAHLVTQFQVSVTYLIAISLTLTGLLQLGFTRYTADRLFEKDDRRILPNLSGALFVTTGVSGSLATLAMLLLFPDQSLLYRVLMLGSFVALSNIWILTIFLSSIKAYKAILGLFALGYGITVFGALWLRTYGLEGLLGSFFAGHVVLMFGMLMLSARHYPSNRYVEFDFLVKGRMFRSLLLVGLFYNVGIWADKFIFWFHPDTSQAIIGPLRASLIYDLPIFLAYLAIIPGMAVFLVRLETDFVEYYEKFYDAVRQGGTLQHIETMRNEMVYSARQGIMEIIKIQSITVLVVFAAAPAVLGLLDISELYLPLLYVDVVAASLQVVLLGVLNVFFYLDQRRILVLLTALFVIGNLIFTPISIVLGASFYGYGFALSLLIAVITGLRLLDRKLDQLEYETFMLQR